MKYVKYIHPSGTIHFGKIIEASEKYISYKIECETAAKTINDEPVKTFWIGKKAIVEISKEEYLVGAVIES